MPPLNPHRDPETALLNPLAIRDFPFGLADPVGAVVDAGQFPVVLGGDYTILIGGLLALRRRDDSVRSSSMAMPTSIDLRPHRRAPSPIWTSRS